MLRLIESFDGIASQADYIAKGYRRGENNGATYTYDATGGVTGGRCLGIMGSTTASTRSNNAAAFPIAIQADGAPGPAFASMWVKRPAALSEQFGYMSLRDADIDASYGQEWRLEGSGSLSVKAGYFTSDPAQLGTAIVADGTWHHIAWEFYHHPSVGYLRVWVDGNLDISYNGDTQGANDDTLRTWAYFGPPSATLAYIDDLIIWDSIDNGDGWNTRKSDPMILETLLPSGPGDLTEFTPSAGENWQAVNSGFVSAAAPARDLYQMADYTSPGAVQSIVVEAGFAAGETGTISQARPLLKTGGTIYPGPTKQIYSRGPGRPRVTFSVNPATGLPWTQAEVNALQFGVERL